MTEYQKVMRMYHEQLEAGTLMPRMAARLRALLDIVEAAPFWARSRVWKKVRTFVNVMAETGGEKDGMD